MQPYFFPYIGYFQLINAVDLFVIYDNIKYTKKGWINRNRLLLNGQDTKFSLPLKNGSDRLEIRERTLAVDFDRGKLINKIRGAYQSAPQFARVCPLIERIMWFQEVNLFLFLKNSIVEVCRHIGVSTEIIGSSSVEADHSLKGQERVIALCRAVGAEVYINPIGGADLYSKENFRVCGLDLFFLKPGLLAYQQFGGDFVPWLSIIDVMMFNSDDVIREHIDSRFELL